VSQFYFAYGSNMNPARVKARGIDYIDFLPGRLDAYQLRFNKRATGKQGVAYANIGYRQGSVVEGVLYRLPNPQAIELMDPFEGHPVRYCRELLSIATASKVELAWVYLANSQVIADGLLPQRSYLNHLLAGSSLYSEAYHQWLLSHECIEDDEADSTVNGLIHNV
jgi:gamma-glutamylcyclotransferase (GGCT)/AIG2-like uncharacterized protein YtfP